MEATRLPNENSDLAVVNAARVSFGKQRVSLNTGDEKLLYYLWDNKHWTPFAHPIFVFRFQTNNDPDVASVAPGPGVRVYLKSLEDVYVAVSLYALLNMKSIPHEIYTAIKRDCPVSLDISKVKPFVTPDWDITEVTGDDIPAPLRWARFRLKMPIFVAREWYRHTVGFVRSEISRRYVDDLPEFWVPEEYRARSPDKKQGSKDEAAEDSAEFAAATRILQKAVGAYYENMIKHNICPEQARAVLPQSMYTEFIETAFIEDYERLFGLRIQPDAQAEIRHMATLVKEQLNGTRAQTDMVASNVQ